LVIPVGLQYNYATTANISMYEDSLTLLAQLKPQGEND
jgi:hypothetical protein